MTCCLEQRLPPDVSPSLESLEGQGGSSECHKETRLLPDVPEYTHWIPLPRCPLSTDWFSFLVWKGSLPHTPRGVPGHPGHGVPWPQLRSPIAEKLKGRFPPLKASVCSETSTEWGRHGVGKQLGPQAVSDRVSWAGHQCG